MMNPKCEMQITLSVQGEGQESGTTVNVNKYFIVQYKDSIDGILSVQRTEIRKGSL